MDEIRTRTVSQRRWLQALVPLLAVACAIPVFARFEHREHLLLGAVRALAPVATRRSP